MARVTLQTIADRVGVSRMTVSNAFSRPDQLSSQLRDRILTAAEELGYAGPDPSARALARGTTGAVGVLLTDSLRYAFTDEVATTFLGAIAEELAPTGLALTLLLATDQRPDDPGTRRADGRRPRLLVRHGIDCGRMVEAAQTATGVRRSGAVRREFRASTSTIGPAHEPPPNTSSISGIAASTSSRENISGECGIVDDPLGAATNHVIKQRLLGWFDALHAAGIEPTVVQEGRVLRQPRQRVGTPAARQPTIGRPRSCASAT